MGVQVVLSYPAGDSFRYMLRSGITGSYSTSIFRFLRELHTALHRACTNLHSQEECRSVLFSPASLPALVVCVIADSHSDWGKVESQCFSFIAKDIDTSSYVYWSFLLLHF
jgi:hypothetical protein